jgi:hypothetical protein
MKHALAPILLSVILGLVFAACAGDDDDVQVTASPQASTQQTIPVDKLGSMSLTAADLGSDFAGLSVDDDSGYQTSDEVAKGTIDPKDSAADVTAGGWSISYKLDYEDKAFAALAAGSGVSGGATQLDVFKDDQSAAAYVTKQLSDLDAQTGKPIAAGVTLLSSGRYDVTAGDGGFGLSEQVQYGTKPVFIWVSGFRLGRLVASVEVSRADNTDLTRTMQQFASTLEGRVRGVISGGINPAPVALPTKAPDAPRPGNRPSTGPYPDTMALLLADLPPGSTKETEGYVTKEDRVSFQRKFNVGLSGAGAGPSSLEVDIDVWPQESGASTNILALKGLYLGDGAVDLFTSAFSAQPFSITNIAVEPATISAIGDESFAFKVSYDVAFGRLENELAYVRIGRVLGTLIFTEFAGDLDPAYVDALMAKLAERISAGLAGS